MACDSDDSLPHLLLIWKRSDVRHFWYVTPKHHINAALSSSYQTTRQHHGNPPFTLTLPNLTVAHTTIHSATFKWHATVMTACHTFSLFGNDQTVANFDHTHLQTHPKHLGQNGPSQWRTIKKGDVILTSPTTPWLLTSPLTYQLACDLRLHHINTAAAAFSSYQTTRQHHGKPSFSSATIFKLPDYTAASR